jgi:hypothetical protein
LSLPLALAGDGTTHRFDLSIGNVPLRMRIAEDSLRSAAQERYRAFAKAQQNPFVISVGETAACGFAGASFGYEFQGARLCTSATAAAFGGVRHEYALDSLLRIQLSWLLPQCDGFLLHAATVVRNGRAFVFMGRSGAGKSTIASLAPEGSVLTDEISLLRFEQNEWRAHGTPFWGEFRAADIDGSAPVAGVFHLVQSPTNRVRPLRAVELLRALFPNILFFSTDSAANERLLKILSAAVAKVNGYELEFRRDRSMWEVLPA